MLKRLLYLCLAVIFLSACSTDQLTADGPAERQITVKARLDANLSKEVPTPKTRLGDSKTRTILDVVKDESKEITLTPFMKEGQKVVCVFYHPTTNTIFKKVFGLKNRPGTKELTDKPDYSDKHEIKETFEFQGESFDHLAVGDWYLMCFTSSNVAEEGDLKVETSPYFHGGTTRNNNTPTPFSGIGQSPELEIPFATLWQKLEVTKTGNELDFKLPEDKEMHFSMLGTLLNINIQAVPANSTQIHNFTLISSGDTKGKLTVDLEKLKTIVPEKYTNIPNKKDDKTNEGYEMIISKMWEGASKKPRANFHIRTTICLMLTNGKPLLCRVTNEVMSFGLLCREPIEARKTRSMDRT